MSPQEADGAGRVCAVTGAGGYVGSRIARRFARAGWNVRALARGVERGEPGEADRRPYSLEDGPGEADLAGVDLLVHCAYDFGPTRWDEIVRVNVEGTARLLDEARRAGVARIVCISTISAHEGCRSLYGRAKLAIERRAGEVGAICVRPGLVHGDSPGGTLGALERVVSIAPLVPLVGDGSDLQYLAHEDDLCELVLELGETGPPPGEGPIVAAAEAPLPLREILQALARRRGRRIAFLPLPASWVMTLLRAAERLGLRAGFRSDSLVSLTHPDPHPVFTRTRAMRTRFRPFDTGGDRSPIDVRWRPGVSSVNADTRAFGEFIARDAPGSFLDVGTGTGYLAIRLARGGSAVVATDLSPRAAELARRNVERNGLSLPVQVADLFRDVDGTFDAIAFNPPFSSGPDGALVAVVKQVVRRIGPLERALMHRMPAEIAGFRRALVERFLREAEPHLSPDGALYLLLYSQEVGPLAELAAGWTLAPYSPPPLAARNITLVKLRRGGR